MAAVNPTSSEWRQSPFYSRTYGGYTLGQVEFIREQIGNLSGKTILDPMGGQAFEVSTWPREGAKVWLGDIDPSLLILASMRSPTSIKNRDEYREALLSKLRAVNRKRMKCTALRNVDNWIAPSIAEDLNELSKRIGVGLFADPYKFSSDFWRENPQAVFEIGVILLAARELSCFRSTDNRTWLRAGGRMRHIRVKEAVEHALECWMDYARTVAEAPWSNGTLAVCRMDPSQDSFGDCPKPSTIVTSPPYANRLEYTRMWGPETEVLATICGKGTRDLRRRQMGTTLVKEQSLRELGLDGLPKNIQQVLMAIRDDGAKYSASYYYPFFQMYAQSLSASLRNMANKLRRRGVMVVIVRDTVRKDQLFATSQLVSDILIDEFEFESIKSVRKVVKGHVGQIRKKSQSGVYGLAQLEWWLSFRKV